MEFYEPDTSSGIDSIPYKTKLTLQEICLVLRRRRLSPLMKICEQRKAGRRKQALLFFLLPMVPCALSPVTRVSLSFRARLRAKNQAPEEEAKEMLLE